MMLILLNPSSTFLTCFLTPADTIGIFVIGLIASQEFNSPQKKELLAFWAPFLLLHLGGPDTITALALQDNELWNRHALQLVTQVFLTVYVFVQSFPHNNLWLPTVFMFVDGLIKYFERTCALYFASKDSFKDSLVSESAPGPNYARLMEEYISKRDAVIPIPVTFGDASCSTATCSTAISTAPATAQVMKPDEMVKEAHRFYDMFKALLAGDFLSLGDRQTSLEFFISRPGHEAFRIVEIELNLIYDVFYTKLFLLQRKRAFARVFCFISVVASALIFSLKDRSKYQNVDVIITFVLLGGAIALDICACLMFVMSDWWIIVISSDGNKLKRCFRSVMLVILRCSRLVRRPHRRRWSQSISKYNLLKRCFKKPPSIFFNFKGWIFSMKQVRDTLIGLVYVENQKADEQLVEYVIEEIQKRANISTNIEVAKEICSSRGNLVLHEDDIFASECLSSWTIDVDYDDSVLIWHLATDICYWTSTTTENENDATVKYRSVSKALSDYMSYLLLRQQTLLSSVVGMSDSRFEDTCKEVNKFMNRTTYIRSYPWWKAANCNRLWSRTISAERIEKQFSNKVLEVNVDVEPMNVKGDRSKSVLFDACRLVKQLEMFGDEKKWEIMSKVWVELLCYAAVRCSPRSHIEQLSKGGELITLAWLFMAHLGLGEHFLSRPKRTTKKMIITK
ncbi:hypothetical protein SOVF_090110 [Spinacia oleracea]|uniref:Uncharacterized protein isoform X2 n=1 Tax=Spinacia oleracea TaxID=3562 RepID=A0A9R0HUA2_SPIOL|nr:uncharacterized protein LOC110776890 isoform X2 [Spinacia oleracea]KNA16327.1 hypothetical protein SOVF_090110 [Spinacia oleracea]